MTTQSHQFRPAAEVLGRLVWLSSCGNSPWLSSSPRHRDINLPARTLAAEEGSVQFTFLR